MEYRTHKKKSKKKRKQVKIKRKSGTSIPTWTTLLCFFLLWFCFVPRLFSSITVHLLSAKTLSTPPEERRLAGEVFTQERRKEREGKQFVQGTFLKSLPPSPLRLQQQKERNRQKKLQKMSS
jgi:hypothetical protein